MFIKGRAELQKAYQDDHTAQEYVERRFRTPLGALLHSRQTNVVRQVIQEQSISRALEIAPGPARLTVDVAPLLDRITLADASGQMLTEARRRLDAAQLSSRATFLQADAFTLRLDEKFPLVYSFRLIRHFERADRMRLYERITEALEPRGHLVFDAVNVLVSGPLRQRAQPGEYEHYDALLTRENLVAELREAGFSVVKLVGVQYRYPAQMACQIYLAPRSALVARAAMEVLERLGGEPLEWIVVCRRE